METSFGVESAVANGITAKGKLFEQGAQGAEIKVVSKEGLVSFFNADESLAEHISIPDGHIIDLESIKLVGDTIEFKVIKTA